MKTFRDLRRALRPFLFSACALLFGASGAAASGDADAGTRAAAPAGFSAARLQRVPALLGRLVDDGDYAGAVWLIARDGHVVQHGAVGFRDLEARAPMGEDTAFAIASMSKIVTTVTALTLLEEGRLDLEDPVSRYLPELAQPRVLVGGDADAPQTVPALRPVTIRQLLTQTSGYSYGFFDGEPWRTIYARADLWNSADAADFVRRAASLPLKHQPGAAWSYGINTDLLGIVIERVTGQSLEAAMRARVLAPLGMRHTGFTPPAGVPLARMYGETADGRLTPIASPVHTGPGLQSGGGGLYSTLHDYARFAQMLLDDGQLDGVRILGRKTVETMRSNQVGYLNPRPRDRFVPQGFGFGVRVRLDDAGMSDALGTPGSFGWEGVTTTYVSIDPKERLLMIVMTQRQPFDAKMLFERFSNTVYQALE
ncbi:serine hydrolase domain-containing protein [Solimonas flava]|uniref:serine hydrolase domain-containing protein n=1 Tax=Solimonas flava TaxID=415849 RepID=UPI00041CFF62|nr:serine hydrolase domain-containing protein [Solimonas flava]